eukprot:4372309-Prymnesium_polylepis.2
MRVFRSYGELLGLSSPRPSDCTALATVCSWAFSVVEQVESQALQQKLLPHGSTLSVQQMVDCDDFSHGCAGGSPETAYDYLTIGGGITTADKYGKYIGNATEKCHFSKASAVITAPAYPAYKSISRGKSGEAAMYAKIASTPMAICVQADLWKSYKGGIISSADGCGGQDPDALNHCVQVVGVGEDAETKSPCAPVPPPSPLWPQPTWRGSLLRDELISDATGRGGSSLAGPRGSSTPLTAHVLCVQIGSYATLGVPTLATTATCTWQLAAMSAASLWRRAWLWASLVSDYGGYVKSEMPLVSSKNIAAIRLRSLLAFPAHTVRVPPEHTHTTEWFVW